MSDINIATLYVLKNEDSHLSGVVTTDQGGMTRFGIAQRFHPDLNADVLRCPVSPRWLWLRLYTR